jgi:hypothetical protein
MGSALCKPEEEEPEGKLTTRSLEVLIGTPRPEETRMYSPSASEKGSERKEACQLSA